MYFKDHRPIESQLAENIQWHRNVKRKIGAVNSDVSNTQRKIIGWSSITHDKLQVIAFALKPLTTMHARTNLISSH